MIALAGLFAACVAEPPGETDDTDTPVDTDTPTAPADGSVPLGDTNNYSYVGVLDAPSFQLAELTDVTLSWSGLTTDIRCHALDPVADIDNTSLLYFQYLEEEEIEQGLSDDSLDQADLTVYLSHEPGDATDVSLSEMTFFGTDADIEAQFVEGRGSWLVLMTTGTDIAVGARMLAFLAPSATESATRAEVTDGCSVLDFSADLASLAPVPVLKDGPWLLDWTALTRNGQAGDFVPTRVDGLMLARFDESVAELEARFLDLELLAEETWTYELTGGTTADLSALAGGDTPFPGFDGDGVWALALTCSSCPNPAPLFLTVLDPQ